MYKRLDLNKYIYQVLGKVLPQILSLLLNSLFIKYIGIDNFGDYNIVLLYFTALFSLLTGGSNIIYQKIHNVNNFLNIIYLKIIAFILIIIPLLLILNSMYNYSFYTIIFFSLGFLMQSIVEVYLVTFRIIDKDKYVLFPKVLQLLSLLVLLFIIKPNDLYTFSYLFLLSWFIVLLFYSKILFSHIHLKNTNVKIFFIQNRSAILYLGFTIFATQVYVNMDFLVLESFYGSNVAGSYKVSLILSQSFLSVVGAFSIIYLSKLSKINIDTFKRKQQLEKVILSQVLLVSIVAILFFLFSILTFEFLFNLLFKGLEKVFVTVSIILISASILNAYSMVYSYFLVSENQEKIIFIFTIYAIVLSIIISFILIPKYGLYGAVSTNILIQLFLLLMYRYKVKKIMEVI